jgi:hypothetical protein
VTNLQKPKANSFKLAPVIPKKGPPAIQSMRQSHTGAEMLKIQQKDQPNKGNEYLNTFSSNVVI